MKRKTIFKIGIISTLLIIVGVVWLVATKPEPQLVVSLRYAEASDGLAPDGTRLSIMDILSDEVVQNVADKTGYPDAASLSHNYALRIGTESVYTTTTYRLEYDDGNLFDHNDVKMLNALGEAYEEYFQKRYGNNVNALSIRETDEQEYIIIKDYLETEAYRIYRYLEKREVEDGKYLDANGVSFSDLKKEAYAIINTDISNLNAYIVESGAVVNRDRAMEYLQYKKHDKEREFAQYMNHYTANSEVLAMYDSAMSAIVMIPTVNKDNEYYMSRTKTGIDYLTEEAETALAEAQLINRKIQEIERYMENVQEGEPSRRVEELITNIRERLNALSLKAAAFDNAYSDYRTAGMIRVDVSEAEGFWFAKKAVLIAALCAAVAGVIVYKDRKEAKHA